MKWLNKLAPRKEIVENYSKGMTVLVGDHGSGFSECMVYFARNAVVSGKKVLYFDAWSDKKSSLKVLSFAHAIGRETYLNDYADLSFQECYRIQDLCDVASTGVLCTNLPALSRMTADGVAKYSEIVGNAASWVEKDHAGEACLLISGFGELSLKAKQSVFSAAKNGVKVFISCSYQGVDEYLIDESVDRVVFMRPCSKDTITTSLKEKFQGCERAVNFMEGEGLVYDAYKPKPTMVIFPPANIPLDIPLNLLLSIQEIVPERV